MRALLDACEIGNAEKLVRNGIERAFHLSDRPLSCNILTSNELLQFVFYLISEARPVSNVDDFLGSRFETQAPLTPMGYPKLYSTLPCEAFPLQAYQPTLEYWWKSMVEQSVILEKDGRFHLDPARLPSIIETLSASPQDAQSPKPAKGPSLWRSIAARFRR